MYVVSKYHMGREQSLSSIWNLPTNINHIRLTTIHVTYYTCVCELYMLDFQHVITLTGRVKPPIAHGDNIRLTLEP